MELLRSIGSPADLRTLDATKLPQLDDAIASVDVKLSNEEIASLEEPYVPHAVVGFT